MKKHILFTFVFLLISVAGFSQKNKGTKVAPVTSNNAVIIGDAPVFAGEQLRLYAYSDMITYNEERIAETRIDSGGKFKISIPVKEITNVRMTVDYSSGQMLIEPGRTYEIRLDTMKGEQLDERTNPNLLGLTLAMQFRNLPANDVNKMVYSFDRLFDDFSYTHFNEIYKKRNKTLIDTLLKEISAKFAPINNDYFKNYINYRIATLAQATFGANKYKLYNKYIYNKPILYNNPEYMGFFNQLYAMGLYSGVQKTSFYFLVDAINNEQGYFKITDMIGRDSLLKNEAIRDLVLIKGLGELYMDNNIKPESIIHLLEQISKESKFEKHRAIAANMIRNLKRFEKGTTAPLFSLNDGAGHTVNPENFKGKFIYLFFWNTMCKKCQLEMDVIAKLYDKFSKDVAFVGVDIDLNKTRYQHFTQSVSIPWQAVYFDKNFNILDEYSVKTTPFFVLLDRSGRILKYPAPEPSENLEGFLQIILKEEKK